LQVSEEFPPVSPKPLVQSDQRVKVIIDNFKLDFHTDEFH